MAWANIRSHQKNLPASIQTAKGHIRKEQQGMRFTKISLSSGENIDKVLIQNESDKSHNCLLTLFSKPEGTSYSDLTGRYPYKSSRGNQYLMVLYDHDTNAILVRPTKTRNAAELRNVTMELLTTLKDRGHPPKLHILDNEASDSLKHALIKHNIDYQLVPPHLHRRNMAERAIQTFKNHIESTAKLPLQPCAFCLCCSFRDIRFQPHPCCTFRN